MLSPDNGKIKLDKVEVVNDEIKNLQKIISIVPQRINLLDDTVKNNILYANKFKNEKNIDELLNKLKDVCLLDFIDKKEYAWNLLLVKMELS